MDDLITVPVLVPREAVAEIQAYAAELNRLYSPDGRGGPRRSELPRERPATESSAARWRPGDEALAEEVVRATHSEHVLAAWRALSRSSADNRLDGAQLNAYVGLDGRGRNGVLSRMVTSCTRRGREGPWRWDPTNNTYWMEQEEAALFSRALSKRG